MKKMSNRHNITNIVFWFLFFSVTNVVNAIQDQVHDDEIYACYQNYTKQLHQFHAANPLIFQFLKANLTLIDRSLWTTSLNKLTDCQTAQDRKQLRELMRQVIVQQAQPEVVRDSVAKIDEICSSERWQVEMHKLSLSAAADAIVCHRKEFQEFVQPMLQDCKA